MKIHFFPGFSYVLFLFTGPVELAAAGVSIALFNQASRITIFPLVSITTSFVAEEDTVANMKMKAGQVENLEDEMLDGLEKGAAKEGVVEKGPDGDDKLENAKDTANSKDSAPENIGNLSFALPTDEFICCHLKVLYFSWVIS